MTMITFHQKSNPTSISAMKDQPSSTDCDWTVISIHVWVCYMNLLDFHWNFNGGLSVFDTQDNRLWTHLLPINTPKWFNKSQTFFFLPVFVFVFFVFLIYLFIYFLNTGCPKKNWTLNLVGHNSKNNYRNWQFKTAF